MLSSRSERGPDSGMARINDLRAANDHTFEGPGPAPGTPLLAPHRAVRALLHLATRARLRPTKSATAISALSRLSLEGSNFFRGQRFGSGPLAESCC